MEKSDRVYRLPDILSWFFSLSIIYIPLRLWCLCLWGISQQFSITLSLIERIQQVLKGKKKRLYVDHSLDPSTVWYWNCWTRCLYRTHLVQWQREMKGQTLTLPRPASDSGACTKRFLSKSQFFHLWNEGLKVNRSLGPFKFWVWGLNKNVNRERLFILFTASSHF